MTTSRLCNARRKCRKCKSCSKVQRDLDADSFVNVTYVDVLGQQFVGHSVLVEDVVVCAGAGECGAEKEAEHSVPRDNNGQLDCPTMREVHQGVNSPASESTDGLPKWYGCRWCLEKLR